MMCIYGLFLSEIVFETPRRAYCTSLPTRIEEHLLYIGSYALKQSNGVLSLRMNSPLLGRLFERISKDYCADLSKCPR